MRLSTFANFEIFFSSLSVISHYFSIFLFFFVSAAKLYQSLKMIDYQDQYFVLLIVFYNEYVLRRMEIY